MTEARYQEALSKAKDLQQQYQTAQEEAERLKPLPEPGVRFTWLVKCFAIARGDYREAVRIAECRYDDPAISATFKIASRFGELSDLVVKVRGDEEILQDERNNVFQDFNDYLMPKTVLDAVPATKVPFRTRLLPDDEPLLPRSFFVLVTVPKELLIRHDAICLLRDQMADALAAKINDAFAKEIGAPSQPIYLADDGGLAVDVAHNLTPEHFERELVTIKLQRVLNWKRA